MSELDDKTLRMMADNASTEHMLLTPFRLMQRGGTVIIVIIFVTLWFGYTLFGWMVNVGEYSLESRREEACDARMYINLNNCDMSDRKPALVVAWSPANNDLDEGVRVVIDGSREGYDENRLFFDPLHRTDKGEADPTPKPWINILGAGDVFERSTDVFRRKSAQMDLAIESAAYNAEELRSVIADIKHINSRSVALPGMPTVYVHRDHPVEGIPASDSTGNLSRFGGVTFGMCLVSECGIGDENLNYALYWGDVIWSKPYLSPLQQHAVNALNATETVDFWLQEAHANGIDDDTFIRQRYSASQAAQTN